MQYSDNYFILQAFSRVETPDEFETFGDDGRLVREHAEKFPEEYAWCLLMLGGAA